MLFIFLDLFCVYPPKRANKPQHSPENTFFNAKTLGFDHRWGQKGEKSPKWREGLLKLIN